MMYLLWQDCMVRRSPRRESGFIWLSGQDIDKTWEAAQNLPKFIVDFYLKNGQTVIPILPRIYPLLYLCLLQYGEGKCGITLQGCHDQIHHLRDISIKDIFFI